VEKGFDVKEKKSENCAISAVAHFEVSIQIMELLHPIDYCSSMS
jgi:hypothetical protein